MVRDAQARLSTAANADRIDAVAIGSPHLSLAEVDQLEALIAGRKLSIPLYACTGRHVLQELDKSWPSQGAGGVGRHHRRRYVRGRYADPEGPEGRRADDQFRQVRSVCAGQHRLRGALWLACRLRRERRAWPPGLRELAMTGATGSRPVQAEILVAGRRGRRGAGPLRADQFLGRRRSAIRAGSSMSAIPSTAQSIAGQRALPARYDRLVFRLGGAAGTRSQRQSAGSARAARARCDPAARPDRRA